MQEEDLAEKLAEKVELYLNGEIIHGEEDFEHHSLIDKVYNLTELAIYQMSSNQMEAT